jgi:hypothetical protein
LTLQWDVFSGWSEGGGESRSTGRRKKVKERRKNINMLREL